MDRRIEAKTGWTGATESPSEAMAGLMSCLEAGKNAWIEVRKNGDQEYPVTKKNPELDNPFNWTMMYGTPRKNFDDFKNQDYFNETHKDLTLNWTACYGTKEAIEAYQKDRTILEGLCLNGGICHPVRIEDANKYRKLITGDDYQYHYWMTAWKPKDGIPYYVIDESVKEVFVVCYNDEPYNKKEALIKCAEFMKAYADKIR